MKSLSILGEQIYELLNFSLSLKEKMIDMILIPGNISFELIENINKHIHTDLLQTSTSFMFRSIDIVNNNIISQSLYNYAKICIFTIDFVKLLGFEKIFETNQQTNENSNFKILLETKINLLINFLYSFVLSNMNSIKFFIKSTTLQKIWKAFQMKINDFSYQILFSYLRETATKNFIYEIVSSLINLSLKNGFIYSLTLHYTLKNLINGEDFSINDLLNEFIVNHKGIFYLKKITIF